jgi:hypothetical protein
MAVDQGRHVVQAVDPGVPVDIGQTAARARFGVDRPRLEVVVQARGRAGDQALGLRVQLRGARIGVEKPGGAARPTLRDRVPSGEPCVLRVWCLIARRRSAIGLIAQLGLAAIPIVRLARPSAPAARL